MQMPTPVKPQNIADLVALVESANEPYAMRYEPEFMPNLSFVTEYAKQCRVSYATAHVCLSTSWGKYQIMGNNLWSFGMSISMPEYCANVKTQDKYFQIFLIKTGLEQITKDYQSFISDESKMMVFASKYNGPDNPQAYVERMKEFV